MIRPVPREFLLLLMVYYSVADLAFFIVFPPFYPKPSYFPCFPQRVIGCLTASDHRRGCLMPLSF